MSHFYRLYLDAWPKGWEDEFSKFYDDGLLGG